MLLLLVSDFLSSFLDLSLNVLLFIEVLLGIGLLIFIHEFGHFIAAKYFGVHVEIFSLGFGAPLQLGKWKLQTFRGDTEYRIAFIPFGGYVKMAGDWPDEETTGAPDEFHTKPIYQRMIIMSAGVVMNAILCLVLFVIAYSIGVQFHAPVVGNVIPGLPAWSAGIEAGDRILKIENQAIVTFDEIIPLIAFTPEKVAIEIERADPQDPQKNIRKTFDVYPAYDEQLGFRAIGIQQSYNTSGTIVKGLAAYEAGLRTEDEILSINGEPASSNRDILKYTQDSLNPDPITIKVKDTSQKIKEIQIFPKASSYFIGVMMSQRFLKAVKGSATPYFQANDEILSVDEQKLHLFEKIHEYALTLTPALQPHLTFMIRRKDQVVAIPVPTSLLQERSFFLHLAPYQDTTALGFILEGKPAHAAGFQIADQVLAINGKKIKTFGEMSALISQSQGQALEFTLQRDGQEIQIRLTPEKRYLFELGIAIGPKLLDQPLKCESFLEAVSLGLRQFKEMSQQIFLMLISLFTREVHPSNLGGPVTIFQASYNFAQFGLGRMIHWLALISINLAILNILPIPVLDGGHLMFLFFEKLKGSPLQPKTLLLFQYVGLIFILILMVYVTFNDISRLLDFLQ